MKTITIWTTHRKIEDKLVDFFHNLHDKLSFFQYMQLDRHFRVKEVQEFKAQAKTYEFSETDRVITDRTTLELVISEICKHYGINSREVYP